LQEYEERNAGEEIDADSEPESDKAFGEMNGWELERKLKSRGLSMMKRVDYENGKRRTIPLNRAEKI